MRKLKLNAYERETLLLKLGVPKEDKFCWLFMDNLLKKGNYKVFLCIAIDCLCEVRRFEETTKTLEELIGK